MVAAWSTETCPAQVPDQTISNEQEEKCISIRPRRWSSSEEWNRLLGACLFIQIRAEGGLEVDYELRRPTQVSECCDTLGSNQRIIRIQCPHKYPEGSWLDVVGGWRCPLEWTVTKYHSVMQLSSCTSQYHKTTEIPPERFLWCWSGWRAINGKYSKNSPREWVNPLFEESSSHIPKRSIDRWERCSQSSCLNVWPKPTRLDSVAPRLRPYKGRHLGNRKSWERQQQNGKGRSTKALL